MIDAAADAPAVVLIPFGSGHITEAVALSSGLGWPYRDADWRFALSLGRGIAAVQDGRLVATGFWWPYGEGFASCGMVIVDPRLQGRGIGAAIMDRVLADIGDRTVILNSTREGQRLYTRLGFVPYGQVRQHQAVLAADSAAEPDLAVVRDMAAGDAAAVRSLDRAAARMDRGDLLGALFTTGSVVVLDRGNGVEGYACVRDFGRGVVIGPVVAGGDDDAKALIAALAARHRGTFVRIDVTGNSGLSPWLETIGLPGVDGVVAMVRGTLPAPATATRLFALSNQSLG
ncbi:GNAT family N-acetyltransferase [Glacieibacterium sp.]|uniref:GNAT family N-acetyltransferase n=1 Tax=Glacieibacterium sp. TaxID=2860237 RepID=UPI003AFF6EAB